jgi:Bifunctional DNA primase/polymerase, N-terminal
MLDDVIYIKGRVEEYINHGFAPVPVKFKDKCPIDKEWPTLRFSEDNIENYFGGKRKNIGILTGRASDGLVDVDIDKNEALRFASRFLPRTRCVFGRESRPKSHWIYRVDDPGSIKQFNLGGTIVEVRGNDHLTVFPGSIHPSGEPIEFIDRGDFSPGRSTWGALIRAASKIATATELFGIWRKGDRHELALATAAMLARLGGVSK